MSTLDTRKRLRHNIIGFLIVTIFCVVFRFVYNSYGHGVESFYMNYVWLWPGITVVYYGVLLTCKLEVSRVSVNLWNAGVATLTVGNGLKGIFEIAGTSSPYDKYYYIVGGALILLGFVFLCIGEKQLHQ